MLKNSFKVITDIDEIAELNGRLAQRLRTTFQHRRKREITYPSGHHTGTVFFEAASGKDVRAWSPHEDLGKWLNFVLSGDPQSAERMEISVQLNFPAEEYSRRVAGAFVVDQSGTIFVAHRGKLTKGNAGLKKSDVFREFESKKEIIKAEDGGKTSLLIIVSALEDSTLADNLWDFGEKAREIAIKLGGGLAKSKKSSSAVPSAKTTVPIGGSSQNSKYQNDRILKLKKYFQEYAGEGKTKARAAGKRHVEHGNIVMALEAQLRLQAKGSSRKNQAIDLAILAPRKVDLYEVKTSASTTDVYTGVGQLLIHGECINELLGLPVQKHLVLPRKPRESHERHIVNKANINIITFEKDGAAYRFNGLP